MTGTNDFRLSFNQVPDVYDAIRPSYPSEMFDVLFAMLPANPRIVEVGPGTGQATKDLLARGASVHAIEIGPATAQTLSSKFPSPSLSVTVADFETTPLPRAAADAVFSASAYHWISPLAQITKPAHVLRLGGLLAIADLIQVSSRDDHGFFAAAQSIYDSFGQGHRGAPAPVRDNVRPEIHARLLADERCYDVAVRQYDWNQTYSAAEYRLLMQSTSGVQMMQPTYRVELLDAMESFINRDFGGMVTRPLVVTITTAAVRPRESR